MAAGVTTVRPSRPAMRVRGSAAARRENVSTSTEPGAAPRRAIRSTTASTSVVVLPVPGPASTSSGPPGCSTTVRWAASSTGGPTAGGASRSSTYVLPATAPIPPRGSDTSTRMGRMSEDLRAAVAGVFDRAADAYDQVGVELFGPVGRRLVALSGVKPGWRVLDVGCGRGAVLLPLADAVGPAGEVVGVDLAPRMV